MNIAVSVLQVLILLTGIDSHSKYCLSQLAVPPHIFNVAAESLYPNYLSDEAKSTKNEYCVPPHKGAFN